MKNYYLILIIFISSYSFSQTLDVANFKVKRISLYQNYDANDYEKIYFSFDIKGNYGYNEIKYTLYHTSITSDNRISISRWNREGDEYLNFPNYSQKNAWLSNNCTTSFKTYSNNSSTIRKFFLVLEYNGTVETLEYSSPIADFGMEDFEIKTISWDGSFSQGDHKRIDYKFDVKGDFAYDEIELTLYHTSISSENKISYSRWNREGDNELNFENYTPIGWWSSNSSNTNFTTYRGSGTTFILKLDYKDLSYTDTYTIPDWPSNDGGDNDSGDDNGNDNNNSYPDLQIGTIKVKKNQTQIFDSSNPNANTPTLNKNNWYTFEVTIENNGEENTNSSADLDLIFSKYNNYPNPSGYFAPVQSTNIGSISEGGSVNKSFEIYLTNSIGAEALTNNETYFLFFEVDPNNNIDEGGGDTQEIYNNIGQIAFKYSSIAGRDPLPPIEQRQLSIYDYSGSEILNQQVESKREEDEIIQNLEDGMYIIKSGEDTYKVRK